MAQHPLENDVILRTIFKYSSTDIDSMANVRGVCKAWKNVIEPEWRSLRYAIALVQHERYIQDEVMKTLFQFMEQQKELNKDRIPHRNFILKHWNMNKDYLSSETGAHQDLNRRFWAFHGQAIHDLTLIEVKGDFINANPQKEESLLGVLPNLERLTLQNCTLSTTIQGNVEIVEGFRLSDFEIGVERERYSIPQDYGLGNDEQVSRGERQQAPVQEKAKMLIHDKVKSIRFENVGRAGQGGRVLWKTLFTVFPNLEEIAARDSEKIVTELFEEFHSGVVLPKLRKLDIINGAYFALDYCPYQILDYNWNGLSLNKLTLDCGFRTDRKMVQNIINAQSKSLETLHLYRAHLYMSYTNFPCELEMANLTEFHLWGNVANNLNFLRFTPKLKVFKWNTTCYDDDGKGVHPYLSLYLGYQLVGRHSKLRPGFVHNIVDNTTQLGTGFKLESLTTLEIQGGSMHIDSWQKLGCWMPNLQKIKAVLCGDDQFALILKQWIGIEFLELAHGSSVSAYGILKFLTRNRPWLNLRKLIFKPCSIPKTTAAADNELEKVCAGCCDLCVGKIRSSKKCRSYMEAFSAVTRTSRRSSLCPEFI